MSTSHASLATSRKKPGSSRFAANLFVPRALTRTRKTKTQLSCPRLGRRPGSALTEGSAPTRRDIPCSRHIGSMIAGRAAPSSSSSAMPLAG
jgi:hypothetical protein